MARFVRQRFAARNNNFILDGVDNNDGFVNTIIFFSPAEGIEEFRVNTSVAPAEYGGSGGAIVQTSIKPGTNQFHGTAFLFRRSGFRREPLWRDRANDFSAGSVWRHTRRRYMEK